MTTIEKLIISSILLLVVGIGVLVVTVSNTISDSGGVSKIIIEAGKELKHISKEIDKD